MKKEQEYLESLAVIRSMMEKSGRFFSLGGISGIIIGIIALGSAGVAQWFTVGHKAMFRAHRLYGDVTALELRYDLFRDELALRLLGLAICTLGAAVLVSLFFSIRQARREGYSILSKPALNLAFNFCLPLSVGGFMCLYFLYRGDIAYIAPAMLLFYGLALFTASRYSVENLSYLALAEIALGLLCMFFPGRGLLFWALGFGISHIIYGVANLRRP